ncbi:MAG: hypothetical protein IH944_09050 [Armatimonadetes bacterium]|nr:hypothetical protein [Armatimonadota bacterium]
MRLIRAVTGIVISVGLAVGYGASQWALYSNQTVEYARRVDGNVVQALALAALLVAIVLVALPDRNGEDA